MPGECDTLPGCEREFIKIEGAPNGLAADASHLFWAVNGEAPLNPGNDLYRFDPNAEAGQRLTDLTAQEASAEGPEVLGVLGASDDGSHVYFVANGVLAAGASEGSCQGPGKHGPLASLNGRCNLYLWKEGTISFVAQLSPSSASPSLTDALDWAPTPEGLFGSAGYAARTSVVSADGRTLLFRSREKLGPYDNEGTPELYRFHVGDAAIRCLSCNPSGESPEGQARFGSITFPGLAPRLGAASVASRNLSADGNRAFFETGEALSLQDTNEAFDVYEWEAPGSGSCAVGSPSYSVLDEGCLYLISGGKDQQGSLFGDASASGDDAFFFTTEQLVGQDQDQLQDVYDARVGGGLPAQNPAQKIACVGAEACHGPAPAPPAQAAPATPGFEGPQNPPPKHKKPTHKKHKKHAKHKHGQAKAKGRAGR